ncbi:MAG: hypothetical protein ACJ75B_22285 [Flavisolibacter sp.]|jgi:hypothetical protein
MNLTVSIIKRLLKRKLATAVLLSASLAAFATLGDGGKRGIHTSVSVDRFNPRTFSLRTGYCNNNLLVPRQEKFILLNTVITYQKGNATYIIPLKKKVLLDKIKFNPAPPKF